MRALLAAVIMTVFSSVAVAGDFNGAYTAHVGDLNTDGQPDIYLKHSPNLVMVNVGDIVVPIATTRRELDQFVLVNQGNGTFAATSVTAQQVGVASQWTAQPIDLSARDINFDGTVDMQLNEVGPLVGGALDHIVFAPQSEGAMPQSVVAMNANVRSFANDVYAALLDPNYFDDNAPWVIAQTEPPTRQWFASVSTALNLPLINQFLSQCGTRCVKTTSDPPVCIRSVAAYDERGVFVGNVLADVCVNDIHIYRYEVNVQRARDYSVFNDDAVDFANEIKAVSPTGIDGLIDEDPNVEPYETLNRDLAAILRAIFGPNSIEEEPAEPEPDYYSAVCNALLPPNNFNHAAFPLDNQFNPQASTFHHYDQRTTACATGEYECSVARFSNSVLPRYTFPSYKLRSQLTPLDGYTGIWVYMASPFNLTDPDSYTIRFGIVTQTQLLQGNWIGAIQNLTTPVHFVYPGTISRVITTSEIGNPRIFTHGIGINQAGTIGGVGINIPPIQMMLGCGNDLFGPVAFRTLDKQAIRYWRDRYNAPTLPVTEPAGFGPAQ